MTSSELMVQGCWEWSEAGIRCTPELAQALGLEQDWCSLAQWWERVPPGEQEAVQQAWQAWVAGERPDLQVEHGWILPGGELR
ncbi:MAG: hypothetical protein Q6K90_07025, partial [Gloeomargarita sp. HHBFW_bins_162]